MYLLESWRRSFSFLKVENLKLLFEATVKTLYMSRRIFLGMFALYVLFDNDIWKRVFGTSMPSFEGLQYSLILNIFFIFLWKIRPFLAVVPKGEIRCDYTLHFVYYFFIPLFFFPFLLKLIQCPAILQVISLFITPFEVFFVLVWLEHEANIKNMFISAWKALKVYFLNFPFCFIFFTFPLYFISFLKPIIPLWFDYLKIFLLLVYFAFFANFYMKRMYGRLQ